MAEVTAVQTATLIASCVSAAGSLTAAAIAFVKFRHETRRPRVQIAWEDHPPRLILRVRNLASERTVYSIGLMFLRYAPFPTWGLEFNYPENFGPALPLSLPKGGRAEWKLPYEHLRWEFDQMPFYSRWRSYLYVDLGEDRFLVALRGSNSRKARRAIARNYDIPGGADAAGIAPKHPEGYL